MTNEKTIRVMGTGHISVKPDTTWLRFDVESSIDYSKRTIDINYREDRVMCCDAMQDGGSAPSIDLTPEDVEGMDTVETVWTLK